MVMRYAPLKAALQAACHCNPTAQVIALTPHGRRLDQQAVQELSRQSGLILLAGRYAGMDQRLMDEADEQWSIGDYVLSGGELPALVLLEAIVRLWPGVLGNADSAASDSFCNGLLGYPNYTRPACLPDGRQVPDVLLSGHHEAIRRWRCKQSLGLTWLHRPDLLEAFELDGEQAELLAEFQRTHRHSGDT